MAVTSKHVREMQTKLGITADGMAGKDFDAAIDALGGLTALGTLLLNESTETASGKPTAPLTDETYYNTQLLAVSEADLGKTEDDTEFMVSLGGDIKEAWCGKTMHRWFDNVGLSSPANPAYSQAWKTVGTAVGRGAVKPGDLVIVPGHVALVAAVDGDKITIRGGNQSNSVCDQPLDWYAAPATFRRV